MKLYFVRHGESEANTLSVISNRGLRYGLTDVGRQQAAALAARLKDIRFAKIVSSPLLRAIQTAEIVSHELGVPYQVTDALREYDCGSLEGQSFQAHWDDYLRLSRDWQAGKWDNHFQGGESLLDIQARFVPFIERITRECGEADNILLVSHGGTLLGALPIMLTNIDHSSAYAHHLGNTDIIIAEAQPHGWVCLSWCDIALAEPSCRGEPACSPWMNPSSEPPRADT
jgi:broad specificity phosphatase PhoE